MDIKIAYSTEKSVDAVVSDIKDQLTGIEIRMILFFASSDYNPETLSRLLHKSCREKETNDRKTKDTIVIEDTEDTKQCDVMGCSTAGELISGKILKNSVVAMAFDRSVIADVKTATVENISKNNDEIQDMVNNAGDTFSEYYGRAFSAMNPDEYAGLILMDGMSKAEEIIMDCLGDLTNVIFVGGSAGDDLQFKSTYIFHNGRAFTDGAVLALIRPGIEFDILKTQSFRALDYKMTATKVNIADREVVEFNGRPAAEEYSKGLNVTQEKLPAYFMKNPVGLLIDNEIFVRSPRQIKNNNILFYCNILEGMEVRILETTDIVKDTGKAIKDIETEKGAIAGIINFHCILRTLELERKGQTQAYADIFKDIPTVGFSTYGEAYIGHINHTSTMLLLRPGKQ